MYLFKIYRLNFCPLDWNEFAPHIHFVDSYIKFCLHDRIIINQDWFIIFGLVSDALMPNSLLIGS